MYKKKVIKYVVLNVLAAIFLGLFLIDFPAKLSHEFMFMTPDSQEYLATGKSYFNSSINDFLLIRPFFFPLILGIFYSIGGFKLWFAVQVIMWLLSVNLLFASFEKLRIPLLLNLIALAFFCTNLSLIAMLFHGLTEICVVFLLCWLMYIIVVNRATFFSMKSLFQVLLLLVVLTIVKPLFLLPTIAFVGLILVIHFKALWKIPKKLILLLLIVAPLFIQILLVKSTYGKFSFSDISSITYRRYIFTQLYQENHNCDREEALLATDLMDKDEIFDMSIKNSSKLFEVFQDNLKYNINGYPVFLELSKGNINENYVTKMKEYNEWLDYIFRISIYWVLLFLIHVFYKRKFLENAGMMFLGLLMYYIYLTSGISAYQGDRLVIVALPIAIGFYFFIANYFYQEVKLVIADFIKNKKK